MVNSVLNRKTTWLTEKTEMPGTSKNLTFEVLSNFTQNSYIKYTVHNSLKFNWPVGRMWKHIILTSGHEFNSQQ